MGPDWEYASVFSLGGVKYMFLGFPDPTRLVGNIQNHWGESAP